MVQFVCPFWILLGWLIDPFSTFGCDESWRLDPGETRRWHNPPQQGFGRKTSWGFLGFVPCTLKPLQIKPIQTPALYLEWSFVCQRGGWRTMPARKRCTGDLFCNAPRLSFRANISTSRIKYLHHVIACSDYCMST